MEAGVIEEAYLEMCQNLSMLVGFKCGNSGISCGCFKPSAAADSRLPETTLIGSVCVLKFCSNDSVLTRAYA